MNIKHPQWNQRMPLTTICTPTGINVWSYIQTSRTAVTFEFQRPYRNDDKFSFRVNKVQLSVLITELERIKEFLV